MLVLSDFFLSVLDFTMLARPFTNDREVSLFCSNLAGEGYQHLLRVLQSMEAERSKHIRLAERLQERLNSTQEQISSLQNSIAQKASQYQNMQKELLSKVSQATDTEKEASQVKK